MKLSLIFFASGEDPFSQEKYRLLFECARFADEEGFSAVWLPERHFTQAGCLYPSPAVLHAALARETRNVRLHAGSVVIPLHNPLRVAEEWSVVDNLSRGRVGISFASGWHPNDFAFFPERYPNRQEEMYGLIQSVLSLWHGESAKVRNGAGDEVEVRIYPTPVQHQLPVWLTAVGNPQTFIRAGELGFNVLTHMFSQGAEELAGKIRLYRESLARHGHNPDAGRVTLMMHTFVAENAGDVTKFVNTHFFEYLRSGGADFLNAISQSRGRSIEVDKMSEQELRDYLQFVVRRLVKEGRVLFGTPEMCAQVIADVGRIGVDEVACQLDFGVDTGYVSESLPRLRKLHHLIGTGESRAPARDEASAIHPPPSATRLAEIQSRCAVQIDATEFYAALAQAVPATRVIERLWRGDGEALCAVATPAIRHDLNGTSKIDPLLLEACSHLLLAARGSDLASDSSLLDHVPLGMTGLRVNLREAREVWGHATLRPQLSATDGGDVVEGDVYIFDERGENLLEVSGLRLQREQTTAPSIHESLLRDWCYTVDWLPLKSNTPLELTAPSSIVAQLGNDESLRALSHELSDYDELRRRLDALCGAFALRTLREMGCEFSPGQSFSAASLAADLGVKGAHRHLLNRLLEMLGEDQILGRVGDEQWEVLVTAQGEEPLAMSRALLKDFPDYRSELKLLESCGGSLREVLRGELDPLQLLFPGGSLDAVERIYQESPFARAFNLILSRVVGTAIGSLPSDRSIRILELGAGTGGATSALVPQLPAGQTDYVFTDVSSHFNFHAQRKFGDFPFMRYQLLNIERDPCSQGFASHQFDLVVAANVLHATGDLREVLGHIKKLLAPGGVLLLLEVVRPQRSLDLIFGLTEGWWKFTDTHLRPSYPLLSETQWLALLEECGFDDPSTFPGSNNGHSALSQQAVILARAPDVTPAKPDEPCSWVILADDGGTGACLAELLRKKGEACTLIFKDNGDSSDDRLVINPSRASDWPRVFEQATMRDCRGVIYLWGMDATAAEETTTATLKADQQSLVNSALLLSRTLIELAQEEMPRLWLVTKGAQSVAESAPAALSSSSLWGLGRAVAAEYPQLWGGMVDLDPDAEPERHASDLFEVLRRNDGENQLAVRRGNIYAGRLVRKQSFAGTAEPLTVASDGTYMVTGGLGGLGLEVADWLIERGARHLLLLSRTELPARSTWDGISADHPLARPIAAVRELESRGGKVECVAVDVADEAGMATLFESLRGEGHQLKGIVHTAGQWLDKPLVDTDDDELSLAFRAKVIGSWLLHGFSRDLGLDFFVLFSSVAAVLPLPGQAGYGAANAFLDALAYHRRGRGLPALSINWGPLAAVGYGATAKGQAAHARLKFFGVERITPEEARSVLNLLFKENPIQALILRCDWQRLQRFDLTATFTRFFSQVIGEDRSSANTAALARRTEVLRRLKEAGAEDQQELLLSYFRQCIGQVLRLESSLVSTDRSPTDLGVDSLMAIELNNRLKEDLGLSLPIASLFDGSSVEELVIQVLVQLRLQHLTPSSLTTGEDAREFEEIEF